MTPEEHNAELAVSMNELSSVSAKDLLDRAMVFSQKLDELCEGSGLPDVLIYGAMMARIGRQITTHVLFAKQLAEQEQWGEG